jgi:hypothetical protein
MSSLKITCTDCGSEVLHRCNQGLRQEVLEFLSWRPEMGFPRELPHDPDADDKTTSFFTEAYLYPLLGKEDARTLMTRFRNLMACVGIPCRELEIEAVNNLADRARRKNAPR